MTEESETDQQIGDPRDHLAEEEAREDAKKKLKKYVGKVDGSDVLLIPLGKSDTILNSIVNFVADSYGRECLNLENVGALDWPYQASVAFMIADQVLQEGGLKPLLGARKDAKKWHRRHDELAAAVAEWAGDRERWADFASKDDKIEKLAEATGHSEEELKERNDDYLKGLLENTDFDFETRKEDESLKRITSDKIKKYRDERKKMNERNTPMLDSVLDELAREEYGKSYAELDREDQLKLQRSKQAEINKRTKEKVRDIKDEI